MTGKNSHCYWETSVDSQCTKALKPRLFSWYNRFLLPSPFCVMFFISFVVFHHVFLSHISHAEDETFSDFWKINNFRGTNMIHSSYMWESHVKLQWWEIMLICCCQYIQLTYFQMCVMSCKYFSQCFYCFIKRTYFTILFTGMSVSFTTLSPVLFYLWCNCSVTWK